VKDIGGVLDLSALEGWLWEAACVIRGPVDAPKFKDYILPLVFVKRLSDVFEDEVAELAREFGSLETAQRLADEDHKLVRLYIPESARWPGIAKKTSGLGEYLTDALRAIARNNPKLQGVVDVVDFNATTAGQRIVDDQRLATLVQVLSKYRLGLNDVEPDLFGRAYEYLLRKFAEGQGQSAGEFYTPREVAILMARILDPEPGMEVYDPCCGSGGLLIKSHLRLLEKFGVDAVGHRQLPPEAAPLKLFGQEINPSTFAIARMNAFIHDMDAEVAVGDTMTHPQFTEGDGRLRLFDLVTANPMWNQDIPSLTYEHDAYKRFGFGTPPSSTADWGWVQHMYRSLEASGRLAVVLDTGAVSRGSGVPGTNKERDARRRFIEEDLVESVILLPENLFYNTTSAGIILVLNRRKRHPGEVLLVNASKQYSKGRPKNRMLEKHVSLVSSTYHEWQSNPSVSVVIVSEEAADNDYNLSPARYIALDGPDDTLSVDDAVVLLSEAEDERKLADAALSDALKAVGVEWTP
jgi:type I restriction enzyme M protein